MPFTVSHAAAALPFGRLKPIWPALIIGTMAPDFEYFLRLSDEDRAGHQLSGLLIWTVPLALLAYWLFESLLREPLVELLPRGVQVRISDAAPAARAGSFRALPAAVSWILIGIATHLLWDSFTHSGTWFWYHWTWLQQMVPVPLHPPVVMSKLLQLVSSVLGLVVLAAWLGAWYAQTKPARSSRIRHLTGWLKCLIVGGMVLVALVIGVPLGIQRVRETDPAMNHIHVVSTVLEAFILLTCVQVLLYACVRTWKARSERASQSADKPSNREALVR